MIGRVEQIAIMKETLSLTKSSFVAFTGRRRVGKTYLINQVYGPNTCLSVTGIQGADTQTQINHFVQKINLHAKNHRQQAAVTNWQDAFTLLKKYIQSLSTKKKQVIFIDELPWICTTKSGFLQLLAHFWNDYLSKENHFILVVCGSATSWITQKIINDKGGLHNRVTQSIHLKPFTLAETKAFFTEKKLNFTDQAIAEIYMCIGGIPFYLENIKKGESPTTTIERMCFSDNGILKGEYHNLYKALFDNPENHEAIITTLANAKNGLSREEIIKKSKVPPGGPFTRVMYDLLISGFIAEEKPYGKKKRGSVYRLIDEYSVFYHRFIKTNQKAGKGIWQILSASQAYKIWRGYAFETVCIKHVQEIKKALGIENVYTETASFVQKGNHEKDGFQIDLIIDRRDQTINLCECKFYEAPFEVTKKYALQLQTRRALFKENTQTKKIVFNTIISNYQLKYNAFSFDCIDNAISISDLMK